MVDKSEMIFGVRAVIEAIQAGKEIDKILVKKDIQSDLSKELFAALKGTLIPVQRVPVERINRITRKNHQGVIAFISSVTYQKTEDLYYKNSRPKKIKLTFSDGRSKSFKLKDYYGMQQIDFDEPIESDSVRVTIESVYKGKKYKDTVISEIEWY